MIARLWETRIDPSRGEAYDAFANMHSRPMFASLPGCLAAFFLGTGEARRLGCKAQHTMLADICWASQAQRQPTMPFCT